MIKLGFAGTGYITEVHINAAKKLDDVSLAAVFSRDKERGKQFVERLNISEFFNDYERMLDKVDAVIVGLPTPFHKEYSIRALSKSKHVLCEKPIALDINDALEMKSASEKSDKILMIAHVLRFWPEYITAKQMINELAAGKVKKVYAYRFSEVPEWSNSNWLLDSNLSGGVPVDLQIHDIDFISWIMGVPIKYYAVGIKNKDDLIINSSVCFQYENATAVAEAGYVLDKGSRFRMGFHIITDNLVLDYSNLREPTLLIQGKDGIPSAIPFENKNAYENQLRYFIECIKENKNPVQVSLSEAIESLRIATEIKSLVL